MKIKVLFLICLIKLKDRYSVMKRKYGNKVELGLGDSGPAELW